VKRSINICAIVSIVSLGFTLFAKIMRSHSPSPSSFDRWNSLVVGSLYVYMLTWAYAVVGLIVLYALRSLHRLQPITGILLVIGLTYNIWLLVRIVRFVFL